MNFLTDLQPGLKWTILGVFTLLTVSSLTERLLQRRWPAKDLDEVRQRIRTWWLLATVFAVALVLGRGLSLLMFAFLSFLALKEYFTAIPTRRADRRVLFWAYLAIPVQYYWVAEEWFGMFIIFIPVYMTLLLQVRMVLIGETKGFLENLGRIQWGLMVTVFSLSHAAFLLVLEADGSRAGPGLVMYLVLLTQLNDVAQFLWGKTLGGPKVLPKVSPGKTYAGFIGGLLTTAVLAMLLGPALLPAHEDMWLLALGAGLLIGLGGFFGDVTISCMKRDLGIKDSGSTLPGHGGILDRVDSLTYTAPLFFHYVAWSYF